MATLKKVFSFSFLQNNRLDFCLGTNPWKRCKNHCRISVVKLEFENMTKLFWLSTCQPKHFAQSSLWLHSVFNCKVLGLIPNFSAMNVFTSRNAWNVIFTNEMNKRFPWKFPWKCFYKPLWTAAFDHTLHHSYFNSYFPLET